MRSDGRRWLLRAAGLLSLLGSQAIPGAAQCALCYTSAAASGNKGIQALQIGILILLIPAVTMLAGVFYFAFRYRGGETSETDRLKTKPHWERNWSELPVSSEINGVVSPR